MIKLLDNYDWEEAFGFCGELNTCASEQGAAKVPYLCEGAVCSMDPFCREDVAEVLHLREGENDGDSWIMVGRLTDGRYFYLEAACDYTGWDCQAGGQAWVAEDLERLVQFGIGQDVREEFGL